MQDKIRIANQSDLDAICGLDRGTPGFTLDRSGTISKAIAESRCYIMTSGSIIQGFAISSPRAFRGMDFLELVVVSPHNRRQGIGSSLITYFREISGTAECWTSTNKSNQAMISLLTKLHWCQSDHIEELDPSDPELFFFIN